MFNKLFINILLAKSYGGVKADIWACGVTFFYFATGEYPFYSNDIFKLKNSIV